MMLLRNLMATALIVPALCAIEAGFTVPRIPDDGIKKDLLEMNKSAIESITQTSKNSTIFVFAAPRTDNDANRAVENNIANSQTHEQIFMSCKNRSLEEFAKQGQNVQNKLAIAVESYLVASINNLITPEVGSKQFSIPIVFFKTNPGAKYPLLLLYIFNEDLMNKSALSEEVGGLVAIRDLGNFPDPAKNVLFNALIPQVPSALKRAQELWARTQPQLEVETPDQGEETGKPAGTLSEEQRTAEQHSAEEEAEEEAERLAKAKEEEERLAKAKEEAERLAKAKEEAECLAKAEEEKKRLAKAKEKEERLKKQASEKRIESSGQPDSSKPKIMKEKKSHVLSPPQLTQQHGQNPNAPTPSREGRTQTLRVDPGIGNSATPSEIKAIKKLLASLNQ